MRISRCPIAALAVVLVCSAAASPLGAATRGMAFMTAVQDPSDERKAMAMVDSIRAFGGPYRDAPIYAVQLDPETNPCRRLAARGVTLVPLTLDPDHFWAGIYALTGAEWRTAPVVEEYATGTRMRAYYTCIVIAFDPARGICREWARVLDALLRDAAYQTSACADGLHRIFLHQAALCGVITAKVKPSEIRHLPTEAGYPFNLHEKLPEGKRFARLNDASVVVLEDAWDESPAWMDAVRVDEPLRSWLAATYRETLKVTDRIWREEYSCNSYLVKTASGGLVVDPGGASSEASWLLKEAAAQPVQAVLLTRAHDDHRKGIALWKAGRDIPVIAQREQVSFLAHNDALAPFYGARFAAQNGLPAPGPAAASKTPVEATLLFDDEHAFTLDDLHVRMVHTGGETPDTSLIWIPELAAAFIGDDYYTAFPNLSTLRGSRPRPALEYVKALDLALALQPELLLPGHGEPVVGREAVRRALQRYRDAIVVVHDAVVAGMNAGKDVHTLMREIHLPDALALPEAFGRVSWSVRGIYEGYAGWFDGNPSSMDPEPASSAYPELVEMAGGPDAVAARAIALAKAGETVRALHLTDMALAASPRHRGALEARLGLLQTLRGASRNHVERQWLGHGISETRRALGRSE